MCGEVPWHEVFDAAGFVVLQALEHPGQPCFRIDAENTTYGTAAFCAFDQNGGHMNFGSWPVDASRQQFIEKATEMAKSVFKLSPLIQVIEAAPRKKWFGLF